VSIHSRTYPKVPRGRAVKDLCWCQSTAARGSGRYIERLSKICAGVNPQRPCYLTSQNRRCQRSVLVSIHSLFGGVTTSLSLSKICAGVNPQLHVRDGSRDHGCQRSVLVSIHSSSATSSPIPAAVKDLCWCQSTAVVAIGTASSRLSKICAGVNPQPSLVDFMASMSCQRSVLVSIHSLYTVNEILNCAVKDLCWCQSTAVSLRTRRRASLSKICAGVNPQYACRW